MACKTAFPSLHLPPLSCNCEAKPCICTTITCRADAVAAVVVFQQACNHGADAGTTESWLACHKLSHFFSMPSRTEGVAIAPCARRRLAIQHAARQCYPSAVQHLRCPCHAGLSSCPGKHWPATKSAQHRHLTSLNTRCTMPSSKMNKNLLYLSTGGQMGGCGVAYHHFGTRHSCCHRHPA